jgi:hypothetical protein
MRLAVLVFPSLHVGLGQFCKPLLQAVVGDHMTVLVRRTRICSLRPCDHVVRDLCVVDETERAHLLAHLIFTF